MEKSKVRQQMQARRLAMTEEEVKRKSEAICQQVVKTEAFQKVGIICIFIPIHNEVDLRELLSICRKLNKRVAAPRIRKGQM